MKYFFYQEKKRDQGIVLPIKCQNIKGFHIKAKEDKCPTDISDANKAIIQAANSLSLVFHKDKELLFWGDIGKKEHYNISKKLSKDKVINFKIIVAPHHGTSGHWSTRDKNITGDVILVSNGKRLNRYLSDQIKNTGKLLPTFKKRDIHLATFKEKDIHLATKTSVLIGKKARILEQVFLYS